MRIAIIVEGETEKAFLPSLRGYLGTRLAGRMPKLDAVPCDGRIPTGGKLQRMVSNLLANRRKPADHVIALTDVYTGTCPPEFRDAAEAKTKMRRWVGDEPRFHPHAAQHDFEAWLLPYWETIKRLADHNRAPPAGQPESVDHDNPPSYRIREVFRIGGSGKRYVKPRDAGRILRENDLSVAIDQCPELKSFVNTILSACNAQLIP
jgi:hypothetical protein